MSLENRNVFIAENKCTDAAEVGMYNFIMSKSKLSLMQEEKPCETIHYYPVIFDNSCKGYKETDAVTNTWDEIANSLEFICDDTY